MDGSGAVPEGDPTANPELAPISPICAGGVTLISEGERRFVFMESLRFLVKGMERQMDVLLCLNWPNSSYPTKLFLPENIGLGLNWNENAFILGRQWFSWSWQGVSPDQAPLAILAGHLEAFR